MASTFLIGIGLVSLVDVCTDDPFEVALLDVPAELAGQPLVLMAPGREEVLGALADPERVTVRPSWEPLPSLGSAYVVARPRGDELPRLPEGYEVAGDWEVGDWRLAEIRPDEPPGPDDTVDLMTRIRDARVAFVHPDGSETPCDRWRFGRWTCGLAEWLWVGPTEQSFRGRPSACIWAHPRAGDLLAITFPGVLLGTRLGGHFGLSDSAADIPEGAPVDFAVWVGDQEERFTARNRRGLQRWQVTTRAGEAADIIFTVSAANDGRRHFCFTASVEGLADRGPALVDPPRLSAQPTRRLRLSAPSAAVEGTGARP